MNRNAPTPFQVQTERTKRARYFVLCRKIEEPRSEIGLKKEPCQLGELNKQQQWRQGGVAEERC